MSAAKKSIATTDTLLRGCGPGSYNEVDIKMAGFPGHFSLVLR